MNQVAYIGLGSNEGALVANLRAGIDRLAELELCLDARSSVWQTEPVDAVGPRWFLNMVVRARTELTPWQLLDRMLELEDRFGRRRVVRNGPRPLDLDLLLVDELRIDSERLQLPHPAMWERRFVLEPLAEIAPELRHPDHSLTVSEQCGRIRAASRVRRLGDLAALDEQPV